ncbi:hypothetical protein [Gemmatimonas groenlandica]|uniref:TonB C-terminal domain-containing protein n=1 Tax=Gemmatimonas groenlandica TaxID=2732249 RepID=A0A6M4IPT3_9BACT|nr:hypothetical protein [Gemmatimonas groenlandica]QJR35759.1 hypothetical protein HKW67_09655 [Gemmatimonas groenlandica]
MPFRRIQSLRPESRRLAVASLGAAFGALSAHALPAQVVAGRVTDDRTMKPAVDFVVRLVQMSDTGLVALDESTTDTKGQFTVVAPSAGSYVLSFGRTAPRVHRVPVEVEAGVAPAPKDFPLPIQRDSDTRPYVDVDVDSAAIMPVGARGPAFPDNRRAIDERGSVFAMFVVDTIGRLEKNSLRLFAGTHADFVHSVERWLEVGKFRVSHVGNVPVRRQVCLAVAFQVENNPRQPRRLSKPDVPPAGLANSSRALCSRAVEGPGMMTITANPAPSR